MIQVSLSNSGRLRLHFDDGHAISIPFTRRGMACLHTVLMAQKRRPHRISTPTSPTQWDIDRWLRTHAPHLAPDLDIPLNL